MAATETCFTVTVINRVLHKKHQRKGVGLFPYRIILKEPPRTISAASFRPVTIPAGQREKEEALYMYNAV
jgi:hypothetical protein